MHDQTVLAEIAGDPARTHGQRLPGDLQRVLEAAAVHLDAVDLLAVVAGPGSFTGLRVGIASMQGLAFSRGLKIVPVSSLEALAFEARAALPPQASSGEQLESGWLVAPWMDAQRGEVFATLVDPASDDLLAPPTSASPSATIANWEALAGGRTVLFAGDGAQRYRDVITGALGARARLMDCVPPLAGTAGRIAARQPERAVLPHAVVPIYVRRPDAELARDRGGQQPDSSTAPGSQPGRRP